MVNEHQNPLTQYFRGTSVFVKLPSCGFYSKSEDFEASPDGEIEVFAMTTADELLFKSPDALLNGESVARVIQNCAPGIKNIYDLPMNDVEVLLLSVRQSTYGNQIDYTSVCPHCNATNEFGIDISWLMSNMQTLEPETIAILHNKLSVKLRPYTYKSSVKAALLAFNEGKFLQMLMEEDLSDEEKASKAAESYKKAVDLTIELIPGSIISVHNEDEDLITDDPSYRKEWIDKASRNDTKVSEKKLKVLNSTGIPRKMPIECNECNQEWETEISFDPSHFFEQDS